MGRRRTEKQKPRHTVVGLFYIHRTKQLVQIASLLAAAASAAAACTARSSTACTTTGTRCASGATRRTRSSASANPARAGGIPAGVHPVRRLSSRSAGAIGQDARVGPAIGGRCRGGPARSALGKARRESGGSKHKCRSDGQRVDCAHLFHPLCRAVGSARHIWRSGGKAPSVAVVKFSRHLDRRRLPRPRTHNQWLGDGDQGDT
jgi:hypothetical protein